MVKLSKRDVLEALFDIDLYHSTDYDNLGHDLKYDEDYFFSIDIGDDMDLRYFKVEAKGKDEAWEKACQVVSKAMIFAGTGNWSTERMY